MKIIFYFALLSIIAVIVRARPAYRARLPNPDATRPSGLKCVPLGHLSCTPGNTRNQFALDFKAAGYNYTLEFCQMDSDGDGVSNGAELGDPCCVFKAGGTPPSRQMDLSHPGEFGSVPLDPANRVCNPVAVATPAADAGNGLSLPEVTNSFTGSGTDIGEAVPGTGDGTTVASAGTESTSTGFAATSVSVSVLPSTTTSAAPSLLHLVSSSPAPPLSAGASQSASYSPEPSVSATLSESVSAEPLVASQPSQSSAPSTYESESLSVPTPQSIPETPALDASAPPPADAASAVPPASAGADRLPVAATEQPTETVTTGITDTTGTTEEAPSAFGWLTTPTAAPEAPADAGVSEGSEPVSIGGVTAFESPVPNNGTVSSPPQDNNAACFPSHATVMLSTGEEITMDALKVGDRVHVGKNVYSEVVMFTHALANVLNSFISISFSTSSASKLELTRGHYLYVNGGRLVAAENVQVGDTLQGSDGTTVTVEKIDFVKSRGLYNPQTAHGDIIVDGIRTSTYTEAVDRHIAHAALAPFRALFCYTGLFTSVLEKGVL